MRVIGSNWEANKLDSAIYMFQIPTRPKMVQETTQKGTHYQIRTKKCWKKKKKRIDRENRPEKYNWSRGSDRANFWDLATYVIPENWPSILRGTEAFELSSLYIIIKASGSMISLGTLRILMSLFQDVSDLKLKAQHTWNVQSLARLCQLVVQFRNKRKHWRKKASMP